MISQSRSLPKHSSYHIDEFFSLCTWIESDHRHTTRSRVKDAGQHLDCSRFTSTVWPEKCDFFSFLYRKIYTGYGYNFFICWFKKSFQLIGEAWFFDFNVKNFFEISNFDNRVRGCVFHLIRSMDKTTFYLFFYIYLTFLINAK